MPTPKGRKRDVTEALDLLKRETHVVSIANADGSVTQYYGLKDGPRRHLVKILKDLDARTGRRDPSKRKAPKRKAARARR